MRIPVLFPMCYFLKWKKCFMKGLKCTSKFWIFNKLKLFEYCLQFSSVQSLSRVWLFGPHGLQHAGPPCPSPTPGVYPNSCPFSWWCHPVISSSVVPFSSFLPSFPASGSFQTSQLFTSGGQSIGVSALTFVYIFQ